jgi:hypothetical protein
MQILAVGLLLPAMGCAPRYVQLAQDSFSKGADIENHAALLAPDNLNDNVSATTSSALIDYTDARDNIRLALGKQRSQLDSDELTGSALALQALISWRLDDLVGSTDSGGDVCSGPNYRECAKASSKQAIALFKDQQGVTRDGFTMAILPGLLDHNLGLKTTERAPKDASAHFMSAYELIRRGLVQLGPINSAISGRATQVQQLQAYGLLAQFQILRAWYAAISHAATPGAVSQDQALTGDQRLACWGTMILPRGQDVIAAIAKLDPANLSISRESVNAMRSSLNIQQQTPSLGACPWQA